MAVGLRPPEVVGAFGCPFEDFALDDPGVGAVPTFRIESLSEFGDGAAPQGGDGSTVVRGKKSCATTLFG
jgi:hypothetical protein